MECDGYVNYKLTLTTAEPKDLKNIQLVIPLRREIAQYMMGMGCKGGIRPKQWQWKWDVHRSNNQLWIGDVNAGLNCKLKHTEERWDLFNLEASGVYRDWGNDGRGGCNVEEVGTDQVVVSAYTGPRKMAAGEQLHFNFGLLITPLKPLDREHWKWRYFHSGSGDPPIAAIAPTGATIVNVHQGDPLNPYINYPLAAVDKLASYAADAHARQMKLKIYYTIRELSNYTNELWALRSLGDEVFLRGPGFKLADQFDASKHTEPPPAGGGSWLREHLVRGYVPAWHTPLGNGRCDAAIATTGLSRWHNFYIEGLNWLIRNAGIDGLYLDGVGYDREIMKRVRKTMQRAKPGCLIDLHGGNSYDPRWGLSNTANQYMELLPYIDSLWLGEGFNYNESPDYWLIEVSGIPYGLFGEMMGGGNPWRGMIFGMTGRLGWGGNPQPLWKFWDRFGIQDARMIGYWDDACPVRTGRKDVLATAYVREGKTLVAIGSWSSAPVDLKLAIDFKALGLDPHRAHLLAPTIAGIQGRRVFQPDEAIPVEPGRGWLLLLDEQSHDGPATAETFPGRKALVVEDFPGAALSRDWNVTTSKHPETAITVVGGELRIAAAANVIAYAERSIPTGSAAVCCTIDQATDQGATWGPGLSLVWRDGRTLRVNLRADGRFGIDDGGRQLLEDVNLDGSQFTLTIDWTAEAISIRATCDGRQWQDIARFPRKEFPGNPISVRIGKTDQHSGGNDFTTPGPKGVATIRNVRMVGQ